ncbi:hypothetical protein GUITHDRAFT_145227 [Guillardia theta CCMP2712]|uniref:MPN domain-containing protein n=1 Tax=Guillardia theta (strain CCMP2712) TaxID=905079 RepID=L1IMK1_GUITC|nr:hypothetical protein GUITHDRAFT_145227 [Guillardia theta CCMP2712]EKX37119.1 hypothetical protein GUITHDRAFT_145227 [Guillardia theta CCMP2712]|mmetsp:Transcript_44823/g.141139  ORF Transcript_44823/g.141139 Transcript_44823/m.141139 type:complete len:262 (-) Transcript_44823:907-1692(-)|eukprot:XP_005824099.1 hypothetical protein GUITHDRAFT_145227 [Guillardia theta CCMP2712]
MASMEPRQLVTLSTTGVCLSMAFAQVLASKGDASGLIFGSVTREKKSLVTDIGSKLELVASIDMQVFDVCNFFDGHGNVNGHAISRACERQKQRLIGWFSFRSNAPLRPSSREMYVQRQIESSPEIKVLLPEGTQPVFGLLSTSYTKNASTHSLDYRFLFKENSRSTMKSLELVIKNVQTDSQEEYGSFSACSKMDVPSLSSLQQSIQLPPPTVNQIENYAEAAQAHINSLVEKLDGLRNEVLNESREVERLQAQYAGIER